MANGEKSLSDVKVPLGFGDQVPLLEGGFVSENDVLSEDGVFSERHILRFYSHEQWESYKEHSSQATQPSEINELHIGADETVEEEDWVPSILIGCAPQLSNLKRIVLSGVDWEGPGFSNEISSLRGLYHSVTSLRLHSCRLRSVDHLYQLVWTFPALTHLHLETLKLLEEQPAPRASHRPAGPQLVSLTVKCSDSWLSEIVPWLTDADDVHFVRHLTSLVWRPDDDWYDGATYEWPSKSDRPWLDELLNLVDSSSLQHLDCIVFAEYPDLSRFSNLKRLAVRSHEIVFSEVPLSLNQTLFQLGDAHHLEELLLDFQIHGFSILVGESEDFEAYGFEHLDQNLAATFPKLTKFSVHITAYCNADEVERGDLDTAREDLVWMYTSDGTSPESDEDSEAPPPREVTRQPNLPISQGNLSDPEWYTLLAQHTTSVLQRDAESRIPQLRSSSAFDLVITINLSSSYWEANGGHTSIAICP